MNLTFAEIGRLFARFDLPDRPIAEISTDSRTVRPGSLFVPIVGDSFDGHDYIQEALAKGALYSLSHKEAVRAGDRLIPVESTRQAFLDIASYYRQKRKFSVAAVTGSVGKTTTKDMMAAVLTAGFVTEKTEGNLNNEIGLPKTILAAGDDTQMLVLEMGMSAFGEIEALSDCAKPDAAVITNIGVSHIETLGSRENIMKAKLEMLSGLKQGGKLILNGDDDLLMCYNGYGNILFYGIDNQDAAIRAKNIAGASTGTDFVICFGGEEYKAFVPALGRHNVWNALAAFGVGVSFGLSPQVCAGALANYVPSGMRQRVRQLKGVTLVEDCYNASPDSVRAALLTLKGMPGGRKIAVLGDMLELGDIAAAEHAKIGEFAASAGVDILYCQGNLSKHTCRAAKKSGLANVRHFETKDKLTQALLNDLRANDVVWVKASRGMRFEDISNTIIEEYGK